jgi:hypothetical protein
VILIDRGRPAETLAFEAHSRPIFEPWFCKGMSQNKPERASRVVQWLIIAYNDFQKAFVYKLTLFSKQDEAAKEDEANPFPFITSDAAPVVVVGVSCLNILLILLSLTSKSSRM